MNNRDQFHRIVDKVRSVVDHYAGSEFQVDLLILITLADSFLRTASDGDVLAAALRASAAVPQDAR